MGKDKEKDVTNHISCSGADVGHDLEHYQDNKNNRTIVRATHTPSLLMPKVAQIDLLPTRTVTRSCRPRFTPALRGPVGYPNPRWTSREL